MINKIIIRKRTVFIFLTLLGLLAYYNSFSVPFHYDDISFLRENYSIKSFQLFSNWITESYSRIITGRAFLLFTFYLNYLINGLDTFGYHIANLLIHISTAFLFYLLVVRYVYPSPLSLRDLPPTHPSPSRGEGKGEGGIATPSAPPLKVRGGRGSYDFAGGGMFASPAPIIAASLFLLHPINTESVTYISSRSSVLSALFMLASMLFFFKATKNRFSIISYIFSIVFFIIGLSTKEAAIVTPALILLFDLYFISGKDKNFRSRIKYHIPFWLIILGGAFYYSHYITKPAMYGRPWLTHILTELKVFAEYLKLLVMPFGLNIDHHIKPSFSFDSGVILSLTVISALLLSAIVFKNKNRVISFSIIWFFINLSPFLAVRLEDYMAERWMYSASLGFSLGVSEVLSALYSRHKKIGAFIVIAVAVSFGILTYSRNEIYKNPALLWADAARKSPEKARPLINLCAAYVESSEMDKAIETCQTAIEKEPNSDETYLNLAAAYFYKNDLNKAEEILLAMVAGRKRGIHADILRIYHYNLGSVYKGKKEYHKAIEEYKKITPQSAASLGLIAECYSLLHMKDKADEYVHLTVRAIPQNGDDYVMQAKSFLHLNENQKAIESLSNAIITDPLNVNVRYAVATIFLEGGNAEAAYKHFSVIANLSPNYAPAYKGMGLVMLAKGNLKEAKKHFNKALSLLPPDSPERKELLELLEKAKE